jgi:hypothetical protein
VQAVKRVVIISDLHCGHRAGLMPPEGWLPETCIDLEKQAFSDRQRSFWGWYEKKCDELQPVDYLFVNGDAIDGKGPRSGGTECLEADRLKQCELAATCIKRWYAGQSVMVYGTPYHNGVDEDLERNIADKVDAVKIGGHEWVNVEGLVFDLKHKVSNSQIPHGRYTAIAREALWNDMWHLDDQQPRADVIVRSHVHYFVQIATAGKMGIITPALQGWGSKYGVRECSGVVHVGLVHFDVWDKENFTWRVHLMKPGAAADMVLTL